MSRPNPGFAPSPGFAPAMPNAAPVPRSGPPSKYPPVVTTPVSPPPVPVSPASSVAATSPVLVGKNGSERSDGGRYRDPIAKDNTQDLIPCCAMCCVLQSCFFVFPDCIGFESKSSCCCLEAECLSCSCVSRDPKMCCIFNRSDCVCVSPSTCIAGKNRICCMDGRCSFPCSEENPCVLGLCPFCVCCICTNKCALTTKIMWCAKLQDILKPGP